MKKTILLTAVLGLSLLCFAQKAKKEKVYDKVYYKITSHSAGDLSFKVDDAVAVDEELKLKLVISNNSADYYIFKPEECLLLVDGKEYKCREKSLTIDPGDKDYKIVNFPAKDLNRFHQFTLKIGGLYKVSAQGETITTESFDLPPLKQVFVSGPFKYELVTDKRSSSGSEFKFDVTYTGTKVGIIRPVYAHLKMPTGNEFQNEVSVKKSLLLLPGENGKLKLVWTSVSRKEGDQQFCKMQIVWKETVIESAMDKQPDASITVDWDEERTKD